MRGSLGWVSSPSTTCRSVRQRPHAPIRTRTWPSPGLGSATVSRRKACRGASRIIARMRAMLVLGRGLALRGCHAREAFPARGLGNTVGVEPQAAMVAESPPATMRFNHEPVAAVDDGQSARLHRWIWAAAIAAVALLVVLRNLICLSGSPPGMYVDESSIAYNAWTIAHFGVDEHGIHFPLFFEAFGEYKNPIYVYSVAALAKFLPMSATVERLPAAIFGLLVVAFLTAAAWRLTGSRAFTIGTLILTALTPWLVIESRVGFETISWVALLSGALWCLASRRPTPRQFGLAGVFLAFAIFGYTTARLEVGLIAIAIGLAWGVQRTPGWWRVLVPIALGYAALGSYALLNPGALTARFAYLNIWADGAPINVVAGRFVTNYFTSIGPRFLFLSGAADPLPRARDRVRYGRRGAHLHRKRPRTPGFRDAPFPHPPRRDRWRRHPSRGEGSDRTWPRGDGGARGGDAHAGGLLHRPPTHRIPESRPPRPRYGRGRRHHHRARRSSRPPRVPLVDARSAVHRRVPRLSPTASVTRCHGQSDPGAGRARHDGDAPQPGGTRGIGR